jgi:hypothetical protein
MINKIDLLISANDKLSMQESGVFFCFFSSLTGRITSFLDFSIYGITLWYQMTL